MYKVHVYIAGLFLKKPYQIVYGVAMSSRHIWGGYE